MLARMDAVYSWLMTRFPVPDSRYHSVKISLAVFGPGRAAAGAPHSLAVDSTLAAPVYEDSLYAPQDDSTTLTLTAIPGPDARILSWTGCDAVSADLGQCVVPLNRSQSVMVNFGRNTTQLTGTVHDLSRTFNIVGFPDAAGNSTVSVNIPADMADMIAEMAAAAIGDFVVGPNGGGFLRRITAITPAQPDQLQARHGGGGPGRGHCPGHRPPVPAVGERRPGRLRAASSGGWRGHGLGQGLHRA